MRTEKIKEKLASSEYDFLRNTPELMNNIIMLTLGGSNAYGTSLDKDEDDDNYTSDIDIRGIVLHTKEEILTMNYREKPFEHRATDTVIQMFKQFITLASNCNPNIIEMLGTKEEHLFMITKEGLLLRDNVDLFLTKRAHASFGGYALQQLRRLENALARDNYPQAEKEKHIMGSIKKQMMTFEDRYAPITDSNLKLYVDKSNNEDYDEEIFIDINLNHYPLRDLKNMYAEMTQVVKDYDKLNHRNSKKDEPHLLKHAMHLVRLLMMGREILEGKGVNTFRTHDRELLLDIRRGKFTYEEIFEMVNKLEAEFAYAKENTALPDTTDQKKISELVAEINRGVLSR